MKRHRFDPFSLLFGALFVGIGVSFLLGSTVREAKHSVWPVFAILVGCTVAAWAIAAVIHDRRPAPEPMTEEPANLEPPAE